MWLLLAVLLRRTFRIRWDEDELTLTNLEEKRYDISTRNAGLGDYTEIQDTFSFHNQVIQV